MMSCDSACDERFKLLLIVSWTNVVLNLVIPFCGYRGARSNSDQLMCCFCGFSLISGIFKLFSLFIMLGVQMETFGDNIVNLVLLLLALASNCGSWRWGKELHENLKHGAVIHGPAPAFIQ